MKIEQHFTGRGLIWSGLSPNGLRIITTALQHQSIRAERRAADEQLGDAQRESERRLKNATNRLLQDLVGYRHLWREELEE